MRRVATWLAVLAALFLTAVASVLVVENRAERRARAFCERFAVGTPFAEVQRAAANEGDARHRSIRTGEVAVVHIGVPPFSRHTCIVEAADGKVGSARYVFID
jgi:hypothetical protein